MDLECPKCGALTPVCEIRKEFDRVRHYMTRCEHCGARGHLRMPNYEIYDAQKTRTEALLERQVLGMLQEVMG